MTSRRWRKRIRLGVSVYLLLVVLSLLALVFAVSRSDRSYLAIWDGEDTTTAVDSTREVASVAGLDPDTVVSWVGGLLLGLLVVGFGFVVLVSFLKRHLISGLVGLLGLVFAAFLVWDFQRAAGQANIRWATLGPVVLLIVLVPLAGAVRTAHPRSRWAINLLETNTGLRSRRR